MQSFFRDIGARAAAPKAVHKISLLIGHANDSVRAELSWKGTSGAETTDVQIGDARLTRQPAIRHSQEDLVRMLQGSTRHSRADP